MTQRFGEILEREGFITPQALQEALGHQREKGGRLGEVLRRLQLVEGDTILRALAIQLNLPYCESLDPRELDRDLLRAVPIGFAKRYGILPLRCTDDGEPGGSVLVAIADPLTLAPLDDLRVLLGRPVVPVVVPAPIILNCINHLYDSPAGSTEQVIEELSTENISDLEKGFGGTPDLLDTTDKAPIVRLVHSFLYQAVKRRASDIHIEPFEREILVRYRIDGVLCQILSLPTRLHGSIASRIKVMAGLDIAEKRLPQDGRISLRIAGKDVDVRVSLIPAAYGERIVLRLLDKSNNLLTFEDLGLAPAEHELMNCLIRLSHGLILVTGPTGSGKTTTIYAALTRINTPDKNILTVEDPIEYQMHGIGQMQVNPKINLTFANGLRSILRQDPDVIMVGEIRDRETADIAIHASLTGHLVFSTLHTNDSAGAITRLVDMGIEPFLVSSSLSVVVAQRLVRVLCPACRQPYEPSDEDLVKIGLSTTQLVGSQCYRASGCSMCGGTGYQGRSGLFEILLVDDEIRNLILAKVYTGTIREAAFQRGMITLKQVGAKRVLSGETTIDEVVRVMQDSLTT